MTAEHSRTSEEERGDTMSAEELVAWADQHFDNLAVSSSFGATSAVMLHLVSRFAPKTPVIFIDTGYLFPETYRFADTLCRRFDLPLKSFSAQMTAARQEALLGNLWEQGEDGVKEYLRINKVEPMQRALKELNVGAWMAGLRASQTSHRSGLPRIGKQDGRTKLHPILGWDDETLHAYIKEHDLPYHPLYAEGYRSIGDHHSTLPTTEGMDPRDGRMLGKKKECGLHLPLSEAENQSLKSSGL